MNPRSLLGLILLCAVVFVAGLGLGSVWLAKKSPAQSSTNATSTPDAVKVLSSKIVPLITAKGQVTKIVGTNLALSYQNDIRSIKINSNAPIYKFMANVAKTNYVSKQVTFKDIAIGDNVQVNVRVLQNGQLEGYTVIITPPSQAPVTPAPVKK